MLVLLLAPTLGSAGEFRISRHIEPNQMSNLLTRHVRKGIIKRVGLTEAQLHEIRDTIDPHREKLLVQITEFKDARIDRALGGHFGNLSRLRGHWPVARPGVSVCRAAG